MARLRMPTPGTASPAAASVSANDIMRVATLEGELAATRSELQHAVHSHEASNDAHKADTAIALSASDAVNATNVEFEALNVALVALNGQLHRSLEQQRTLSDDLQNVLFSTNVATLFLDRKLRVRFFTPATKLLFNVAEGDIGRPLADLGSLAADGALPADARAVLRSLQPIEREIEARTGAWYTRRIMPAFYRTRRPQRRRRHHIRRHYRTADHLRGARGRQARGAARDHRQVALPCSREP